jgi:hypothetical protein
VAEREVMECKLFSIRLNWRNPLSGSEGQMQVRRCRGKRLCLAFEKATERVHVKVAKSVSADTLMTHICAKTYRESVYDIKAFKGYQSYAC